MELEPGKPGFESYLVVDLSKVSEKLKVSIGSPIKWDNIGLTSQIHCVLLPSYQGHYVILFSHHFRSYSVFSDLTCTSA